jgi:hypothetical protein
MQFRSLGGMVIRPASIPGNIYETFASVIAVFKGITKKILPTERMTVYGE